jgi:hypothetical protein
MLRAYDISTTAFESMGSGQSPVLQPSSCRGKRDLTLFDSGR